MACVDAKGQKPIGADELIHWPEEDGRRWPGPGRVGDVHVRTESGIWAYGVCACIQYFPTRTARTVSKFNTHMC